MKTYFLFNSEIRFPEQLNLFINGKELVPKVPPGSVVMVSEGRDHSEFTAFLVDKNRKIMLVGHGFSVFFNSPHRNPDHDFVDGSSAGPYISFARHEEFYLDIFNKLEGKTWAFLNAIRDYHYLRTYKAEADPLKSIQNSEAMEQIVKSRWFRYMEHRGFEEFMFRFRHKREFYKMSNIDFSMRLKGIPVPAKVAFDFTAKGLVPSRLFTIIGKNGVGKSRCLKEAKNRLLKGEAYRKIIALNLYKSVNGPRSPDFISLNIDPRDPINFASSITRILERRRRHDFFDSTEILRDILRKDLKCSDVQFCNTAGEWRSIWKDLPYDALPTVGEVKFLKENGQKFILSQGQICLLSIAILLLIYVEKNTIILFDEPETNLHPNYIVKLVDLLEGLLERTDSVALLATHSIFLVRELPKTSVHVMVEDADGVRMTSPNTETFGATLDRLAYEFFSDEDVNKKYERFVEDTKASLKKLGSNARKKRISELSPELASRVLSND